MLNIKLTNYCTAECKSEKNYSFRVFCYPPLVCNLSLGENTFKLVDILIFKRKWLFRSVTVAHLCCHCLFPTTKKVKVTLSTSVDLLIQLIINVFCCTAIHTCFHLFMLNPLDQQTYIPVNTCIVFLNYEFNRKNAISFVNIQQ